MDDTQPWWITPGTFTQDPDVTPGEEELLDAVYEHLPSQAQANFYGVHPHGEITRPELYVTMNGQCWRVLAEPHPHPEDAQ